MRLRHRLSGAPLEEVVAVVVPGAHAPDGMVAELVQGDPPEVVAVAASAQQASALAVRSQVDERLALLLDAVGDPPRRCHGSHRRHRRQADQDLAGAPPDGRRHRGPASADRLDRRHRRAPHRACRESHSFVWICRRTSSTSGNLAMSLLKGFGVPYTTR